MGFRRPPAPRRLPALLLALGLPAFAAAPAAAQRFVYTAGDTLHPRVQYADSTISLNDRCIVRMTKLGLHQRPVYVNGKPIGFC